jgi:hypothetical protein
MLAAFAGLAAAQTVTTMTVVPESYPTLRSEGLTEAVPALDFTLNVAGAVAVAQTATYDLYIYGKAGAPFTSPAASIAVTGGLSGTPLVAGSVVKIPGVVFSFPMTVALASSSKVTVTGIRVDANAIGPNSPLSFQIVAIPTSGAPAGLAPVAQNIDTVTVGTISVSLKTTLNKTADNPIKHSTTSGAWTSNDGAGNSFDPTETDPAKLALQSNLFTVSFAAQYPGAFDTTGAKPLRFTFTLTNIPAGLALYVPQKTAQLVLINGADANGLGGYPAYPTVAAYPVPANGMVTYEAIAVDGSQPPPYVIPVYSVGTSPLGVTSAAAPFTFVGSYAPLSSDISASATAPILRFAKTSVTTIDSFLIVTLPSSTFAFPYLVSGGGWVTGIAVINGGSGWDSAADIKSGTAGTCKLTFFSADGTAVPPASVTVPLTGASIAAIPAGGNYGFTLDQAIGAGSYAGIVFGTCNFDNVKAFGYLNGAGTTAAYLAQ